MFRNSVLYRRFLYAKKRNSANIHIISRLIPVILIFAILLAYVEMSVIPYLNEFSQNKAKEIFISVVNSVVQESLTSSYIHKNLISTSVDKNGNLRFVQMNSLQAEKLSARLSYLINKKLNALNPGEVNLPIGMTSGVSFFSKQGPLIHIRYTSFQKVKLVIKSVISNETSSQTSYLLTIVIKSNIGIKFPFSQINYPLFAQIPISETIIFR